MSDKLHPATNHPPNPSVSQSENDSGKENIRIFVADLSEIEFARRASESVSDSDLLRQALRDTEVLLDDTDNGALLYAKRRDGTHVSFSPSSFRDADNSEKETVRRSLMLSRNAKSRIDELQIRLRVADISAVARFALRFFSKMVREAAIGSRFYVREQSGEVTEIRFGMLSASAFQVVSGGRTEERSFSADALPQGGARRVLRPARPRVPHEKRGTKVAELTHSD